MIRKFLSIVLAMMLCAAAFGAQAQTMGDGLGYQMDVDGGVFTVVSPQTYDLLEESGFLPSLAGVGVDAAYFEHYDERVFDLGFCMDGTYGNLIVRLISKETSEGLTLEDYYEECETSLIPGYVRNGMTILFGPEIATIGGREMVGYGLLIGGREMVQYMTINEHTGRWYNFTFTRISKDVYMPMLESLKFGS